MTSISAIELPAILGGTPAVNIDDAGANRWPILTDEEVSAVTEVLRSGELSLHRVTRDLEDDYKQVFGARHAIAYCNATSAIFAALHAFGLKPGDEVIVPSATYWASVMPALWCGAVPVFCESEPRQLGLDPEDVVRRITDRTKAMVLVHLWGMPSRMEALLPIAREYKLKVLEDASHAHGARWRGQRVGTFGDASVFSLQTNKLAPAGEGGILLTNDDELHEYVICLGHFERILDLPSSSRRFAGTGFGHKHRMAPLSAAVARVQLRHLPERNAHRNANIEYLSKRIEPLGINTFLPPDDVDRVYFLFMAQNNPDRTKLPTGVLVKALQAEGCKVAFPRYPLLHQQPVFTEGLFAALARIRDVPQAVRREYSVNDLPITTAANQNLVQLPSFPSAGRTLLDQYAFAFEKVVGAGTEIASRVHK